MPLKIATWNINSVRLRQPLVERFLAEDAPDVLCLQETKCPDKDFPAAAFAACGYVHQAVHGQKSYNGVAILSRVPLAAPQSRFAWGREDCRHLWATLPDGTELHNLYIPAGGDIPDPAQNWKFDHKLGFIRETADWFADQYDASRRLVVVGDLNIAPLEHDVWSHKQLLDVVSHTPVEVDALTDFQRRLDFIDAARHFIPASEKLYSWWSYRNRDWAASDRGRRLDHIWLTPPLGPSLSACTTRRDLRSWDSPSDHVPVVVELA